MTEAAISLHSIATPDSSPREEYSLTSSFPIAANSSSMAHPIEIKMTNNPKTPSTPFPSSSSLHSPDNTPSTSINPTTQKNEANSTSLQLANPSESEYDIPSPSMSTSVNSIATPSSSTDSNNDPEAAIDPDSSSTHHHHPHSRFTPEFPRFTEDDLEDLELNENRFVRFCFMSIGLISLALGILGIFLPVLPTSPFILLSAYLFARSSPKLYLWLLNHRHFGPPLRKYRKYRVIPRPAKIGATILIIATLSTTIIFFIPIIFVKILLACIGTSVLIYIWRHPSHPPKEEHVTIEDIEDDNVPTLEDIHLSSESQVLDKERPIVDLLGEVDASESSGMTSEIPL